MSVGLPPVKLCSEARKPGPGSPGQFWGIHPQVRGGVMSVLEYHTKILSLKRSFFFCPSLRSVLRCNLRSRESPRKNRL